MQTRLGGFALEIVFRGTKCGKRSSKVLSELDSLLEASSERFTLLMAMMTVC